MVVYNLALEFIYIFVLHPHSADKAYSSRSMIPKVGKFAFHVKEGKCDKFNLGQKPLQTTNNNYVIDDGDYFMTHDF